MRTNADSLRVWLSLAAVIVIGVCVLAAWMWAPIAANHPEEFAAWFKAHRDDWYALPAVVMTFIMLGLAMVPVMVLIAATGIAFGPLLGPTYAMAGCLASASIGFAIGRSVGLRRVQGLGGERILRIAGMLRRNGTLAVFLIRKVPAPFTLVNIVVGASNVAYRDFVIGTVLGMGALVIALAGLGSQITEALHDPTPRTVARAAMFVVVPLLIAIFINHFFRRERSAT